MYRHNVPPLPDGMAQNYLPVPQNILQPRNLQSYAPFQIIPSCQAPFTSNPVPRSSNSVTYFRNLDLCHGFNQQNRALCHPGIQDPGVEDRMNTSSFPNFKHQNQSLLTDIQSHEVDGHGYHNPGYQTSELHSPCWKSSDSPRLARSNPLPDEMSVGEPLQSFPPTTMIFSAVHSSTQPFQSLRPLCDNYGEAVQMGPCSAPLGYYATTAPLVTPQSHAGPTYFASLPPDPVFPSLPYSISIPQSPLRFAVPPPPLRFANSNYFAPMPDSFNFVQSVSDHSGDLRLPRLGVRVNALSGLEHGAQDSVQPEIAVSKIEAHVSARFAQDQSARAQQPLSATAPIFVARVPALNSHDPPVDSAKFASLTSLDFPSLQTSVEVHHCDEQRAQFGNSTTWCSTAASTNQTDFGLPLLRKPLKPPEVIVLSENFMHCAQLPESFASTTKPSVYASDREVFLQKSLPPSSVKLVLSIFSDSDASSEKKFALDAAAATTSFAFSGIAATAKGQMVLPRCSLANPPVRRGAMGFGSTAAFPVSSAAFESRPLLGCSRSDRSGNGASVMGMEEEEKYSAKERSKGIKVREEREDVKGEEKGDEIEEKEMGLATKGRRREERTKSDERVTKEEQDSRRMKTEDKTQNLDRYQVLAQQALVQINGKVDEVSAETQSEGMEERYTVIQGNLNQITQDDRDSLIFSNLSIGTLGNLCRSNQLSSVGPSQGNSDTRVDDIMSSSGRRIPRPRSIASMSIQELLSSGASPTKLGLDTRDIGTETDLVDISVKRAETLVKTSDACTETDTVSGFRGSLESLAVIRINSSRETDAFVRCNRAVKVETVVGIDAVVETEEICASVDSIVSRGEKGGEQEEREREGMNLSTTGLASHTNYAAIANASDSNDEEIMFYLHEQFLKKQSRISEPMRERVRSQMLAHACLVQELFALRRQLCTTLHTILTDSNLESQDSLADDNVASTSQISSPIETKVHCSLRTASFSGIRTTASEELIESQSVNGQDANCNFFQHNEEVTASDILNLSNLSEATLIGDEGHQRLLEMSLSPSAYITPQPLVALNLPELADKTSQSRNGSTPPLDAQDLPKQINSYFSEATQLLEGLPAKEDSTQLLDRMPLSLALEAQSPLVEETTCQVFEPTLDKMYVMKDSPLFAEGSLTPLVESMASLAVADNDHRLLADISVLSLSEANSALPLVNADCGTGNISISSHGKLKSRKALNRLPMTGKLLSLKKADAPESRVNFARKSNASAAESYSQVMCKRSKATTNFNSSTNERCSDIKMHPGASNTEVHELLRDMASSAIGDESKRASVNRPQVDATSSIDRVTSPTSTVSRWSQISTSPENLGSPGSSCGEMNATLPAEECEEITPCKSDSVWSKLDKPTLEAGTLAVTFLPKMFSTTIAKTSVLPEKSYASLLKPASLHDGNNLASFSHGNVPDTLQSGNTITSALGSWLESNSVWVPAENSWHAKNSSFIQGETPETGRGKNLSLDIVSMSEEQVSMPVACDDMPTAHGRDSPKILGSVLRKNLSEIALEDVYFSDDDDNVEPCVENPKSMRGQNPAMLDHNKSSQEDSIASSQLDAAATPFRPARLSAVSPAFNIHSPAFKQPLTRFGSRKSTVSPSLVASSIASAASFTGGQKMEFSGNEHLPLATNVLCPSGNLTSFAPTSTTVSVSQNRSPSVKSVASGFNLGQVPPGSPQWKAMPNKDQSSFNQFSLSQDPADPSTLSQPTFSQPDVNMPNFSQSAFGQFAFSHSTFSQPAFSHPTFSLPNLNYSTCTQPTTFSQRSTCSQPSVTEGSVGQPMFSQSTFSSSVSSKPALQSLPLPAASNAFNTFTSLPQYRPSGPTGFGQPGFGQATFVSYGQPFPAGVQPIFSQNSSVTFGQNPLGVQPGSGMRPLVLYPPRFVQMSNGGFVPVGSGPMEMPYQWNPFVLRPAPPPMWAVAAAPGIVPGSDQMQSDGFPLPESCGVSFPLGETPGISSIPQGTGVATAFHPPLPLGGLGRTNLRPMRPSHPPGQPETYSIGGRGTLTPSQMQSVISTASGGTSNAPRGGDTAHDEVSTMAHKMVLEDSRLLQKIRALLVEKKGAELMGAALEQAASNELMLLARFTLEKRRAKEALGGASNNEGVRGERVISVCLRDDEARGVMEAKDEGLGGVGGVEWGAEEREGGVSTCSGGEGMGDVADERDGRSGTAWRGVGVARWRTRGGRILKCSVEDGGSVGWGARHDGLDEMGSQKTRAARSDSGNLGVVLNAGIMRERISEGVVTRKGSIDTGGGLVSHTAWGVRERPTASVPQGNQADRASLSMGLRSSWLCHDVSAVARNQEAMQQTTALATATSTKLQASTAAAKQSEGKDSTACAVKQTGSSAATLPEMQAQAFEEWRNAAKAESWRSGRGRCARGRALRAAAVKSPPQKAPRFVELRPHSSKPVEEPTGRWAVLDGDDAPPPPGELWATGARSKGNEPEGGLPRKQNQCEVRSAAACLSAGVDQLEEDEEDSSSHAVNKGGRSRAGGDFDKVVEMAREGGVQGGRMGALSLFGDGRLSPKLREKKSARGRDDESDCEWQMVSKKKRDVRMVPYVTQDGASLYDPDASAFEPKSKKQTNKSRATQRGCQHSVLINTAPRFRRLS